ncbi:PAC2 family protein [Herbiconiux moechotypicola]|uniref:PAC2 family protein n=1 Tax=Herbiconiux moechotypicola TaxID=637393 RepID=A0ABP5Q0Q2_9MICO|nr:PAC2 family protein [Herbiconiux moechotypicola]MCS5728554.1 PAC2 family protein [Herbiconiux moechotypicola]
MDDPSELYTVVAEPGSVPAGLPLVAALNGFTDAGGAVAQLGDHLLDSLESEVVVEFDTDVLLDYRARRPIITFDGDHISEYEPQSLTVNLVTDEIGQQFLFLNGFEPDFQWERFVAAVIEVIDLFQVSTTTWVHAIPMPVPHTRPVRVTVSGNRSELIEALSVWRPTTQAPANALHLLEYRLHALDHPVAGFVLLVPHYLADTEYPATVLVAVESISAATGLIFPTDRVREENREFAAKIDEQVSTNTELARLVHTLEERHDSYMEGTSLRSPLTDVDGELPSADEIGAELERFLAGQPADDQE